MQAYLEAWDIKQEYHQKGPDRGRDILASPDGLGLEEPRIIVEVKHRNGQMGVFGKIEIHKKAA